MKDAAKYPVAVVGAGKIGQMITRFLVGTGDYQVKLIDQDTKALAAFAPATRVEFTQVDVQKKGELEKALKGQLAVVNATPYYLTERIATAAKKAGVHYLDLT
ncbi:MAG: saccharopine dehydrogenase NADP-binding domain-containing protein, partial [Gammaproteobacteria bacterium]